MTIPLFDFKQQQNSFGHSIEIDEAKVKMRYGHERIYLIIMSPMKSDGQELVMEYISDVTHRIQTDKLDMLEKAHRLSVTDELTELYNRRYIRTALPVALDACSEHNAPLSFIFADLDYFKQANDLCGHAAGDQLLCEFASVLHQNLRKGMDWAVRYGSDEFLLCLCGAGYSSAKTAAERIRKSIISHSSLMDTKSGRPVVSESIQLTTLQNL